eukprot:IDg8202t1
MIERPRRAVVGKVGRATEENNPRNSNARTYLVAPVAREWPRAKSKL